MDTQSVKCVAVRGPRGYDAAKKVLGRKRVALVDADGTWLAVAVVPANTQDRDCLDALTRGKEAWPSLREAVLDGAFAAERCQAWCNHHVMRRRVVERAPDQKGFVVLGRRWVVEHSLGWLAHRGGLLRDRAGRLDVSAARLACVAGLSGVEAMVNPTPARNKACRTNSIRLREHSSAPLVKRWREAPLMPVAAVQSPLNSSMSLAVASRTDTHCSFECFGEVGLAREAAD